MTETRDRDVEVYPDWGPPLLLKSRHRISPATIEHIKSQVDAAFRAGKVLLFDESIDVYQLIGGRWEPLPPAPGASP